MKRRTLARVVSVGIVLAALAGCETHPMSGVADSYRLNPSPAEETLSERAEDILNRAALVNDENLRMGYEDWERLWLYERPSRLSPTQIPR